MGRIKKRSALGQISGAVGDVVLSQLRETTVVRSKQGKRNTPATQAQMEQHAKMALAVGFVKTIKKVVSPGFSDYSAKMSGYNAAVKHALNIGITGEYPNYDLNYSVIPVTKGALMNEVATAAIGATDTVVYTWQYDGNEEVAASKDKAVLVVYCPALNKSLHTLAGAERGTGTASISVARFKGNEVHTWLAFISADGLKTSDSAYTGKLTIS